jgi:hypothetical protein
MGMASYANDCYDGGTTSCDSSDYVWNAWTTGTVTSVGTADSGNDVWYKWIDSGTSAIVSSVTYSDNSTSDSAWTQWVTVSEEVRKVRKQTEEEIRIEEEREAAREEEIRAQNEKWSLERKRARERRELAEIKAKELLEIFIGKEEMKVYEKTGRIFVKGKDADYHIVKGDGYNIRKIEKGKVRDLCVHLEDKRSMPATDNVMALFLHLRADEKAVIELANDHGISRDKLDNLPLAACAGG